MGFYVKLRGLVLILQCGYQGLLEGFEQVSDTIISLLLKKITLATYIGYNPIISSSEHLREKNAVHMTYLNTSF